MRSPRTGTHPPEYYGSETVAEKYVSTATEGLTELERAAVSRYFTATGARVLDLGCGTGRTTTALDQMGYEVVGIDLTEPFVEYAHSFVPGADVLVGDTRSLPFQDETFQYALFSYNGIDDISPEEDRYRALREIYRVLKPGGVFVFSSRNRLSTYVLRSFDLEGVRQYVAFWLRNIREGRLFSRYKSDNTVLDGPRLRYHVRPEEQKQQLRNCGFDVLSVLRTDGALEPYFHHPYYVAQKPDAE